MKCFLLAAALIIAIAATEGTVHCHGSYYWIYKIKVQKSAIDEKCNASKNIVVWYSENFVVDLYVWLFAFDKFFYKFCSSDLPGRRYGEKRIPIKKEIVYGPKLGSGIIGKKKSGFLDGFYNRGFLGGSKKGLAPRGRFGPGGRFGSNIPLVPGGINTQINGGLFPDPQFGGRFGQGGFSGDLGSFDQFGLQNGGRFGP